MKQRNPIRVTAWFTLFIYVITNHFGFSLAHAAIPIESVQMQSLNLGAIKLPSQFGEVVETSLGKSKDTVIIIQDAHAIPDAQKNISNLIKFFEKTYGVNSVALEGASGDLDPQIFKSFPDKKLLREVFKTYFDAGEIAGGTAAAIFNNNGAEYRGIEDWEKYQDGLALYLAALEKSPDLLVKLSVAQTALNSEKQKAYSKELNEVDSVIEKFYSNVSEITELLKVLGAVQAPQSGSDLNVIWKEIQKGAGGKGGGVLDIEIRKIAAQIEKVLKGSEAIKSFNARKQEWMTGVISAEDFGVTLKEFADKSGAQIEMSTELFGKVHEQRRLKALEGTKLFRKLEAYIKEIKQKLIAVIPVQAGIQDLDRRTENLRLIQKLVKLELSREEWNQLKGQFVIPLQTGIQPQELAYHFSFYANAEERDEIFFRNILKTQGNSGNYPGAIPGITPGGEVTVIVAGGFHAEGLMQRLKASGIGYALLMPKIKSIPENSAYQAQMRGEVSWKNYFEVENGRINLYKAFVRAMRDKLITTAGKDQQNTFLLKSWRDQIIRDLADQNKIERAQQYTRFIDEVLDSTQDQRLKTNDKLMMKVEKFIDGLFNLQKQNQFTSGNIASLLKSTAIPVAETAPGVLVMGDKALPRAEMRKLALALIAGFSFLAGNVQAQAPSISSPVLVAQAKVKGDALYLGFVMHEGATNFTSEIKKFISAAVKSAPRTKNGQPDVIAILETGWADYLFNLFEALENGKTTTLPEAFRKSWKSESKGKPTIDKAQKLLELYRADPTVRAKIDAALRQFYDTETAKSKLGKTGFKTFGLNGLKALSGSTASDVDPFRAQEIKYLAEVGVPNAVFENPDFESSVLFWISHEYYSQFFEALLDSNLESNWDKAESMDKAISALENFKKWGDQRMLVRDIGLRDQIEGLQSKSPGRVVLSFRGENHFSNVSTIAGSGVQPNVYQSTNDLMKTHAQFFDGTWTNTSLGKYAAVFAIGLGFFEDGLSNSKNAGIMAFVDGMKKAFEGKDEAIIRGEMEILVREISATVAADQTTVSPKQKLKNAALRSFVKRGWISRAEMRNFAALLIAGGLAVLASSAKSASPLDVPMSEVPASSLITNQPRGLVLPEKKTAQSQTKQFTQTEVFAILNVYRQNGDDAQLRLVLNQIAAQLPELNLNESAIKEIQKEIRKAAKDGKTLTAKDLVALVLKKTGKSPQDIISILLKSDFFPKTRAEARGAISDVVVEEIWGQTRKALEVYNQKGRDAAAAFLNGDYFLMPNPGDVGIDGFALGDVILKHGDSGRLSILILQSVDGANGTFVTHSIDERELNQGSLAGARKEPSQEHLIKGDDDSDEFPHLENVNGVFRPVNRAEARDIMVDRAMLDVLPAGFLSKVNMVEGDLVSAQELGRLIGFYELGLDPENNLKGEDYLSVNEWQHKVATQARIAKQFEKKLDAEVLASAFNAVENSTVFATRSAVTGEKYTVIVPVDGVMRDRTEGSATMGIILIQPKIMNRYGTNEIVALEWHEAAHLDFDTLSEYSNPIEAAHMSEFYAQLIDLAYAQLQNFGEKPLSTKDYQAMRLALGVDTFRQISLPSYTRLYGRLTRTQKINIMFMLGVYSRLLVNALEAGQPLNSAAEKVMSSLLKETDIENAANYARTLLPEETIKAIDAEIANVLALLNVKARLRIYDEVIRREDEKKAAALADRPGALTLLPAGETGLILFSGPANEIQTRAQAEQELLETMLRKMLEQHLNDAALSQLLDVLATEKITPAMMERVLSAFKGLDMGTSIFRDKTLKKIPTGFSGALADQLLNFGGVDEAKNIALLEILNLAVKEGTIFTLQSTELRMRFLGIPLPLWISKMIRIFLKMLTPFFPKVGKIVPNGFEEITDATLTSVQPGDILWLPQMVTGDGIEYFRVETMQTEMPLTGSSADLVVMTPVDAQGNSVESQSRSITLNPAAFSQVKNGGYLKSGRAELRRSQPDADDISILNANIALLAKPQKAGEAFVAIGKFSDAFSGVWSTKALLYASLYAASVELDPKTVSKFLQTAANAAAKSLEAQSLLFEAERHPTLI